LPPSIKPMLRCRDAYLVIVLAIILTIFPAGPIWGQEDESAGNVFGFAEFLYDEGDYFRAIGEYKRFIFLHPTAVQTEKAAFRIVESYFHAKRWPEAIVAAQQFLAKYPASPLYFQMLYLKGRLEKLDNKHDEALNTFNALVKARVPQYSDKAVYQKALIHLERLDWQGAHDLLLQVPTDSPVHSLSFPFAAEVVGGETLPRKSPLAAGLLAAALPGAGHLYAARPRDALVAFLLNGTFVWGVIELFRHDDYVAGGILSFFELGWYSGNIYSAISSVHKYNRNLEEDFIRRLENKYTLSFQHVQGVPTITIGKRF